MQTYQQPQQPVQQPQLPVQQPQLPEGATQIQLVLDDEAMKIVNETSIVLREAIINMSIKLFAKTNTYKEFMLLSEFREELKTEELVTSVDVTNTNTTTINESVEPNNVSSTPVVTTTSGFKSW